MEARAEHRPAAAALVTERVRERAWLLGGLALAGLAILYWVTGPTPVGIDAFVPLADAFLDGRLYYLDDRPWLERVARPEGGWYVPYPPGPAILVLPFVAVAGVDFDQGITSAFIGAVNAFLVWRLLERAGVRELPRAVLAAAFALGTVHWWAAGMGTSWLFAQTAAVFFALLGLNVAIDRRAPFAVGVLLGLAAACRLPVGLTLPLYAAFFLVPAGTRRIDWRDRERLFDLARLVAGVAVPAVLVALYNVARFGNPLDFGYADIPGVATEPWYASGILSIEYIPRHIHAILIRGFDFTETAPWFRPNWTATSLVITSPFLLWLVKARWRDPLLYAAWLSVAIALVPILTHGNVGFTQWSYRYVLDIAPVLFLILGWVFRERISWEAVAAVVVAVAVNAYGIWAITALGFVSF